MKGNKVISALTVFFIFLFCVILGFTTFAIIEHVSNKEKQNAIAAHITGSGTESDPYLIYTVSGYKTLCGTYASTCGYNKVYAKLMDDLIITVADKTGLPDWIDHLNRCLEEPFKGGLDFDGNYKQITFGVSVSVASSYQVPAIGVISRVEGPTTIKNLKTKGTISVTGDKGFTHVGALIGVAAGTNADGYRDPNVTIDNCYVGTNITSNTSSVAGMGGLIGYAVNSSGGFSGGSITVKDTVYCGTITGACSSAGKITAYENDSNFDISISLSNSYCSGSITGVSSDSELGNPYSKAYSRGASNLFVDGEWSNYSSYGYTANPNISWLTNRSGISPNELSYKSVLDNGDEIDGASGSVGYYVADDKSSWNYDHSAFTLTTYNFGVVDTVINLSSYVSTYAYEGGELTNNGTKKKLITLTFKYPKLNIYFILSEGINAYYSVNGGADTQITSYYAQTATKITKISVSYDSGYEQEGCYPTLYFSFTNYDGDHVIVKYEIKELKYYISGYEYKLSGTTKFIPSTKTLFEVGIISEFRVETTLKSYNVKFE